MSKQFNVLIGYTSRLFCDGLKSVLGESGRFNIVDTFPVWKDLINRIENLDNVDNVIIELCKPRKHDIEHITNLMASHKEIKILLISHLPHYRISKELIEGGMQAYLLKSCNSEDLFMALDKMSNNLNFYCADITNSILKSEKNHHNDIDIHLTEREKEILSQLVNGNNNLQIANKLELSENTIKVHRRNIQNKFGVNNMLGMVRYACRANLVDFGRDEYCMECPHCISP